MGIGSINCVRSRARCVYNSTRIAGVKLIGTGRVRPVAACRALTKRTFADLAVRSRADYFPDRPRFVPPMRGRFVTSVLFASLTSGAAAFLELVPRTVNREAAGLLTWREFLERGQELPDVLLRRNKHERMIGQP